MKKRKKKLTELEGAMVSEVFRRGTCTAYQLRHEFLKSPSAEWSGSAGAIYPALRRLRAAGLVSAKATGDRRGTERYSLTAAGSRALTAWLTDFARAVGPGTDPFRSRAGLWPTLPTRDRERMVQALSDDIRKRCAMLKLEMKKMDVIGRRQAELELKLQLVRLKWLRQVR
jgi:DNA-binding PadR family transcriptional regulator